MVHGFVGMVLHRKMAVTIQFSPAITDPVFSATRRGASYFHIQGGPEKTDTFYFVIISTNVAVFPRFSAMGGIPLYVFTLKSIFKMSPFFLTFSSNFSSNFLWKIQVFKKCQLFLDHPVA